MSQKKLAEALGISAPRLNNYLSGRHEIPLDMLVSISILTNSELSWLLTGNGQMYNVPAREGTHGPPLDPSTSRHLDTIITLPVVADIAAGLGIEAEDIAPSEHLSVPTAILTDPAPYYCFRVSGTSMEPELHTGDYAIVSSWRYDGDYSGRICAFRSIDGLLIKRFYVNHRGKNALLIPLNAAHPIMVYDEHSPDITMLGVLTAIIRKYST